MTTEPAAWTTNYTVARITEAAKRAIDPATTVAVFVDAFEISSGDYSVNFAEGTITFTDDQGNLAVTVTSKYVPLLAVSQAKSVDIQLPAPVLADVTLLGDTAPRQLAVAQKCSLSLAHFHQMSDDLDTGEGTLLLSTLLSGAPIFVEVKVSTLQTLRGWFMPTKADWKHGLDSALEGTLELTGVVQTCVGRSDQALFSLT